MNDDGQHEYDIDIPSAKRLIIVMQSRLLYSFSNAVVAVRNHAGDCQVTAKLFFVPVTVVFYLVVRPELIALICSLLGAPQLHCQSIIQGDIR